jgi:hypothetical protein
VWNTIGPEHAHSLVSNPTTQMQEPLDGYFVDASCTKKICVDYEIIWEQYCMVLISFETLLTHSSTRIHNLFHRERDTPDPHEPVLCSIVHFSSAHGRLRKKSCRLIRCALRVIIGFLADPRIPLSINLCCW